MKTIVKYYDWALTIIIMGTLIVVTIARIFTEIKSGF